MKLVKPQAPWEGEIEEGAKSESTESFFSQAASWVVQRADKVNIALLAWSVIVIAFSLLLIYSQAQRNRASEESLRVENADLKKQVADLQDDSIERVLADKDKRIDELLQQIEKIGRERDAAVIEKQKANDAKILAEAQTERGNAVQERLRSEVAALLDDRNDSRRAYQDALSKYSASQKEVRFLQGRLAQCGRSGATKPK
jgi:hypothetical protein